jgi:hypothetical protein
MIWARRGFHFHTRDHHHHHYDQRAAQSRIRGKISMKGKAEE